MTWLALLLAHAPADAGCTDRHCQLTEAHMVKSTVDPTRPAQPPVLDRRAPKRTSVATFARG